MSQDIKLYHKVSNDHLVLRWMPYDVQVWKDGIANGYQLTVTDSKEQLVLDTLIRNSLKENYKASEDLESLYASAYHEQLIQDYLRDHPDTTIVTEFSDTILHQTFLLISAKNRTLLENAGLLISFPIETAETYNVKLSSPSTSRSKEVTKVIVPSMYQSPSIPELTSKWNDKSVDLAWTTKGTKESFMFYNLYRSEDGASWQMIDSLYANFYEESDEPSLLYIKPKKELPTNDTTYYFKIHAIDFFGDETEEYSMVSGMGSKGINVSPFFENVEQLRSNEAKMTWKIPKESGRLVEEYRVYVAEDYEGPYILDSAGIAPEVRSVTRPIPFRSAYFRVAAVDRNENEYSSFPQLVMSVDTIAPAIPRDLEYEIDTLGHLTIQWSSNDEEDFIGYKLFMGYDTTVDMTLAHNGYLTQPIFRDTIELKTTNRKIYYKAISVDRRNNRSDFSRRLTVIKPDVLPPVEPQFIDVKSGPGSIDMKWYLSISKDVVEQRLFRKRRDTDQAWELIKIWSLDYDSTYADTGLEAYVDYAYTLTVIDSAGNESAPAHPVISFATPDNRGFDLEDWKLGLQGGTAAKISHDLDISNVDRIYIYRKKEDESIYNIGNIGPEELIYLDKGLDKGKRYAYAIKVMFKSGIESQLSEFKTIQI